MQLPPDEVPDGLSTEQYEKMMLLYLLMGKRQQIIQCSTRAPLTTVFRRAFNRRVNGEHPGDRDSPQNSVETCQSQDETVTDESLSAVTKSEGGATASSETDNNGTLGSVDAFDKMSEEPNYEAVFEKANKSVVDLMRMIQEAQTSPDHVDQNQVFEEILETIKSNMLELTKDSGASEADIQSFTQTMEQSFADIAAKHREPLLRDVPAGLSAQDYYDLGVRYKEAGWTEQARDSLRNAMELDPDGDIGKRALKYLQTKVPRHPVPLFAEQENVAGYNLMESERRDEARKVFEDLIRRYPDFEWPYGNLGALLLQEGDPLQAEQILIKAIQINPHYMNAWLHLSRANMLTSKFQQASYCLTKGTELDPQDESIELFRSVLERLQELDV